MFEETNRPLTQKILACQKNKVIRQVNDDSFQGRLWLLEGHPNLQDYEGKISQAVDNARTGSKCKDSFLKVGICHYMLQALAEREGFEFIIVDLSPSSGALSRCMAMSCDFIMPPCYADVYSAGSIHGLLTRVLPQWYE